MQLCLQLARAGFEEKSKTFTSGAKARRFVEFWYAGVSALRSLGRLCSTLSSPGLTFWWGKRLDRGVACGFRWSSTLLGLRRFFANAADPSFCRLGHDLNIGKAGVGEEFAMFVHGEERHARERQVFFGDLGHSGPRSFIYFRDDDEPSTGLEDS